ncbi:MAG: glycosyltransferase [Thermoplasmata archaeon]
MVMPRSPSVDGPVHAGARPAVLPRIAVVIGAVERARFLQSAVDSVLAQTLPRSEYEILVTRDFRSPSLDPYLRANGVPTIEDPDRRMGRVIRAARSTRAPLIAFLDDDDLFEPERLAHILETFQAHPEISFYRNRVSVVDEVGLPVDPRTWGRLYRAPSLDRTGPLLIGPERKVDRWKELLASFPEFNLSSMVVRREVLEGARGALLEEMGARIDLAQFVLAYLSPGAIYLDDRRLTRYRQHLSNNSRIRVRRGQRTPKAWAELGRLERLARDVGRADVAHWVQQHRITGGLGFHVDRLTCAVHNAAPGATVSVYAREYLHFAIEHPRALLHPWAWRPLGFAAAQVAVPPLTRVPGVDLALRREILPHYPRGAWAELVPGLHEE